MRLTRRQLKRLINEAMKTVYGSGDHLAIMTNYNNPLDSKKTMDSYGYGNRAYHFVLYDPNGVYRDVESLKGISEKDVTIDQNLGSLIVKNTKAILSVVDFSNFKGFLSGGAWVVNRAAAIESYGPTMYDLVMSIAPNGLTADRASVTDDAKSLWQYYANNRSDVLKTYLDNSKDPKTPDIFDDTLYGHGSSDDYGPFSPTNIFDKKVVDPDYLNMVYSSDRSIGEYEILVDNHEIFINALKNHDSFIGEKIRKNYSDAETNTSAYYSLYRKSAAETVNGNFFQKYYS